jgi:DNA polymerase I-like protein with 3'-5' exonuclease and polymerase domains
MTHFHERLSDHLNARLVSACHDELVVECPEEQAEEVAAWLEGAMIASSKRSKNALVILPHELPRILLLRLSEKSL